MVVTKNPLEVYLPAQQREQSQQVLPGWMCGTQPRRAQDKKDTGGKGDRAESRGRVGLCFPRVLLQGLLELLSLSGSNKLMLHLQ